MASDSGPSFTFPYAGDLMVLDTPLLRVSRPVAACSRCRAAKVKCDGKLPACTACEKSNKAAECSSTNDQFARGKERSYVATLEARVEKLEKKLAEARARRKSSAAMSDVDGSATPRKMSVDMLMSRHHVPGKAARRKEASDIDNLVSDFGLLAVNATARDFHGFTSAMSYARLILSACAKEPMPKGVNKGIPARYAATPLIQHYLNNIFVLLPAFEEATFYASVDAVYHHDKTKATAFDHWTVRLVLALSSISLSKQRGDVHYFDAVGYANGALEFAEDVLHPGFITSIQALLLLTEYAMMDPHHFDSWGLIGAASRAMVDIGLHQDPAKRSHLSKAKLELRRRVFWCVYSLDRSTSLVQTRAFSFGDDSANVSLPFNSNISPSRNPPKAHLWLQNFDPALNFFKIRQIQSDWYSELFQSSREQSPEAYTYIWKIYREMTDWYNDISKTTLPATKTFFELELLYSYVYILSPSPRCPIISNYAQRLIFEHCIAYAITLLAALSDDTSPTTRIPMTFYDAMRAYMTGRQFVDVLQRNPDVLLNPIPPTPPATSPPVLNHEHIDPFAAPPEINPPPFPAPVIPPSTDSHPAPRDPTTRAIAAINDFTEILSRFGMRFGYINWRDRFQRESATLVSQLYGRQASASPPPQPPQPQQQYPPAVSVSTAYMSAPAPAVQPLSASQPTYSQPLYPGYAPHHPPTSAAQAAHAVQAAQAHNQTQQSQSQGQPYTPVGQKGFDWNAASMGLSVPLSVTSSMPPPSPFGSSGYHANISPGGAGSGDALGGDYLNGRFI